MQTLKRIVFATLCVIGIAQVHAAGLDFNSRGITFPDGSTQTTAAVAQTTCTPITQADIPLSITTSGVYCLTEDINSNSTSITISTDDVVLNLNGHTVTGTAGSNVLSFGIQCNGGVNTVISNGTVSHFFDGIKLYDCDFAQLTHLRLTGNYYIAIESALSNAILIAQNHIADIGGSTHTITSFNYAYGIRHTNGSDARVIDNDIQKVHAQNGADARGL